MSQPHLTITLQPSGRRIKTAPGTPLLTVAGQAGEIISTPCGGAGSCGKCRVQFTTPPPEATPAEIRALSPQALKNGWRLACQQHVERDATIHIPEESRFAGIQQILAESDTAGPGPVAPVIRRESLALSPPSLEDNRADWDRLQEALGPVRGDLELIRLLPARLRAQQYRALAVLDDGDLIDVLPEDKDAPLYGVAFDIGTTTIAGVLLNLESGAELAVSAAMNPQTAYGDDVLSRIQHASTHPEGEGPLQEAIRGCLNKEIETLCAHADVRREAVYEVVCCGNTTMQHLLCGFDPRPLGQAPFVPSSAQPLRCRAADLGLRIHPRGRAWIFPVIAAFVGGDIVAGLLCTQLDQASKPTLMIDIGTNGELALAHGGQLWAASTAAGPAFEGARISCGMRAGAGAIESAVITDDLEVQVIGGGPARGICGSGLIDLVAALLRQGLVTPSGALVASESVAQPRLRQRFTTAEDGDRGLLLGPDATPPLFLEKDIRELQLANAALRAGIEILLKQAGLAPEDLHQVWIAGGFGSFIRRKNAQRIGLIPAALPHEAIRYVGNTALNGARWATLAATERARAEDLARRCRHIELSQDPDFAMAFAMAMQFPESD